MRWLVAITLSLLLIPALFGDNSSLGGAPTVPLLSVLFREDALLGVWILVLFVRQPFVTVRTLARPFFIFTFIVLALSLFSNGLFARSDLFESAQFLLGIFAGL